MVKIYLFLLANSVLPLFSQISWTNNAIRIGDKIIKQQYPYVDPGKSGLGQVWDLRHLHQLSREYTMEYIAPELLNDSIYILGCDTFLKEKVRPGELIIGLEHYAAYYYHQRDSALLLLGYENPLTLVHYKEPVCLMYYPLDISRVISQSYYAKNIYSSEKEYATEGVMHINSDADGSLILPSGDTICQVTRIKTVQTIFSVDKDSISLPALTAETHRWYAKGYRYPLFETLRIIENGDKHEIFNTSYYYPPESHSYIEDDLANLSILDQMKIFKEEPVGCLLDSGKEWMFSGKLWACSFYPNPVVNKLNIEFRIDEDVPTTVLVYDLSGRLLLKLPEYKTKGQYIESIDFTAIQTGNYILKFICGEEQKNQIIIKK